MAKHDNPHAQTAKGGKSNLSNFNPANEARRSAGRKEKHEYVKKIQGRAVGRMGLAVLLVAIATSCHLIQESRVQHALDDVVSDVCSALTHGGRHAGGGAERLQAASGGAIFLATSHPRSLTVCTMHTQFGNKWPGQ